MKRVHIRVLSDDELRPQLETGDIIFFLGRGIKLQEVERQVERLGFAEQYIVSATQRPNAERAKIRVKPVNRGHRLGLVRPRKEFQTSIQPSVVS
jgi:hypothetical protein